QDPEPGRTWVWLDEAKWKSLVPAQPKVGDSVAISEALANRIFRLTMLDTIYCFSWPWPGGALRSKDLTLRVAEVGPGSLTMRLEGALLFEEPARTFDVSLAGTLEYDRKAQAFKRIDITGVGDWTWPKRKANQKQILGVSIELWPHQFASPAYDRFFPG